MNNNLLEEKLGQAHQEIKQLKHRCQKTAELEAQLEASKVNSDKLCSQYYPNNIDFLSFNTETADHCSLHGNEYLNELWTSVNELLSVKLS